MPHPIFSAADLLLPGCPLETWSVVACDQYTSQPEYWSRVATAVGDRPSALHCVFPEAYFAQESDFNSKIAQINNNMEKYLSEKLFRSHPKQYLYLERTLRNGKKRRGLIGKIDLEAYSYLPGSRPPVRPTEGTVESRLPPRVKIRAHAPIELPHVMMLLDDPQKNVIEPISTRLDSAEKVYDFTLMEGGGHLQGWLLCGAEKARIDRALAALFAQMPADGGEPMLIAVGDGNHSLATAKACFESLKKQLPENEWAVHPARWALVELGNLHDDALVFEPIHRVVTGVNLPALRDTLQQACKGAPADGQQATCVFAGEEMPLTFARPSSRLAVGTLQQILDDFLAQHGGEIDYIHGADVVRDLIAGRNDAAGFLLPVMRKDELFAAVRADGALARKTFSMGEAWDKRYYLEARKIR